MNVIDLRDALYERRIEIIEITDSVVYYAEEIGVGDEERIYIYSYDNELDEERVISEFTLENNDFIQHFYICGGSIIILFENDGSSAWIVKIDKLSGVQQIRRKISLVGKFFECVPIDENNLMIYTRADEENRTLFNRCFETTNSETMANLYDIEKGYRYFVKDFKTAALIENGTYSFVTAKGEEKLILCDPYCGEEEKEELVRILSAQSADISDELRDNIWLVSKQKLLAAVRSGSESISLRRAASAGLEGTVRFECICGDRIIFRAKVYRSQLEQFFEMSALNGKITPLRGVRSDGGRYYTDSVCGKIYYIENLDDGIKIEGEIGSAADIICPDDVGDMLSCIDDRYVIATRSLGVPITKIYDSRLGITDTFEARAGIRGTTVVLY